MKTIGGCSHSRQRVLFLRFPADLGEKQEKTIIIARQSIKKQRHHFAEKGLYSQSYDFFSSPVLMRRVEP